jgi:hypothetical protein
VEAKLRCKGGVSGAAGDQQSVAIIRFLACLALALAAADAHAQTLAPPVAPDTITRDAANVRAIVRFVKLATPLELDGRLDEEHYQEARPISDFIQLEPRNGEPATEKTDVWLGFDAGHVYVSMRVWESRPERMVVSEMRRDSNNIRLGESIWFAFDTFHDRRNAVQFEVNPLGGRTDAQSTNERQYNPDWNLVWDLAVGTFEGGWTLEAAIPFKSLRYGPGSEQTWGFQARRNSKWKNEISFLTHVPASFGLSRGSHSASIYPETIGLEAPPAARSLEIKPYAIADLSTDRTVVPRIVNDPGADAGLDVKIGVTQGLTADLTYNTDFAQVEADEQQVNLTRFSLFFPEKREFFTENQGTFTFGGAGGVSGVPNGDGGETPLLFYSRRIGLESGTEVPILAGARLTGRVGATTIGVIDMHTRDEPKVSAEDTNFLVLRVKRDILRRSSIGALVTSRSVSRVAPGSNQTIGADATFGFFSNLSINTFIAKTATEGLNRDDLSYRAQLDYAADRYGVQIERLSVGEDFNPEVGFVRRYDIRRNFGLFRFSPRPRQARVVRRYVNTGSLTYTENGAGRLETRIVDGEFAIEFQNSDRLVAGINDDYEFLRQPFAVAPGVAIPVGGYSFVTARGGYTFGQQRPVSGAVLIEHGGYYDGERTTLTLTRSRTKVTPQFSIEPSLSLNKVDRPAGSFTASVIGARATYTVTPLMFASAFLQYGSSNHGLSANLRFRWEYRPGSEMFVVYNEERNTLVSFAQATRTRSLIFKINRLFRP